MQEEGAAGQAHGAAGPHLVRGGLVVQALVAGRELAVQDEFAKLFKVHIRVRVKTRGA
jgi:hypothetical protein